MFVASQLVMLCAPGFVTYCSVDAWLAIASRREVREYAPAPLGDELERRILEAGRISGSSRNTPAVDVRGHPRRRGARAGREGRLPVRQRRGRRVRGRDRRLGQGPRGLRRRPRHAEHGARGVGRRRRRLPERRLRQRRDGRAARPRGRRARLDRAHVRPARRSRATRRAAVPRPGSSAPTASRSTRSSARSTEPPRSLVRKTGAEVGRPAPPSRGGAPPSPRSRRARARSRSRRCAPSPRGRSRAPSARTPRPSR